jgi:hypothetical protein
MNSETARGPRWLAVVAWGGLVLTLGFAVAGLILGVESSDLWSVETVAFATLGALIAIKRPQNRLGWIALAIGCCSGFAIFAFSAASAAHATGGEIPSWVRWSAWVGNWSLGINMSLLILLLLMFPNGGLLSPRWRVVGAAVMVAGAAGIAGTALAPGAMEPTPFIANPLGSASSRVLSGLFGAIFGVLLVGGVVCAVIALGIRSRRGSYEEKLQLRWLIYSTSLIALVLPFTSSVNDVVFQALLIAAFTTIPIAAAVAILKYRLYGIDVIINKTLVYGILTAVLVAAYLALVFAMQLIVDPITSGSDLSVGASTLLVAALFGPLRRRIQSLIDRRFYRRRFDAQRTLEVFSAHLRDEVDLDSLTRQLTTVVGDTMQPSHVSLWLRGSS